MSPFLIDTPAWPQVYWFENADLVTAD